MALKAVLDTKRHILDGSQSSDLVAVVAMNDAREDEEKHITMDAFYERYSRYGISSSRTSIPCRPH